MIAMWIYMITPILADVWWSISISFMAQIPILYHFVMVNSCRTSQFYAYVLETGRTLWYTSNAGDARGFSQGLHGGIQTWPRPAQPEMGILVARIASLTSMLDGVKNMVASHWANCKLGCMFKSMLCEGGPRSFSIPRKTMWIFCELQRSQALLWNP